MPAPKRYDIVPLLACTWMLGAALIVLLPSSRNVAGMQAQWLAVFGTLRNIIANLLPSSPGDAAGYAADRAVSNPGVLRITGFLVSLLAPVALLLGVAFTGLTRRENSVAFLTRGLARWGGVLAGMLLLVYAVTLTITVREETSARDALARTAQHEGRYLADIQHRSWPQ